VPCAASSGHASIPSFIIDFDVLGVFGKAYEVCHFNKLVLVPDLIKVRPLKKLLIHHVVISGNDLFGFVHMEAVNCG
jgi:hypothetical protein